MVAAAVMCGVYVASPLAYAVWAGGALVVCLLGALMLWSQPLGVATIVGLVGSQFVGWGFRTGGGRLLPAVMISWLVWVVVGSAAMMMAGSQWHVMTIAIAAAWMVDVLGLFYITGILINAKRAGRVPMSLVNVAGVVLAMIVSSAVMWFVIGTEASRSTALLIAGAPPALAALVCGLFMSVVLMGGKKMRWN